VENILEFADTNAKDPVLVIYSTMMSLAKDPEQLAERLLSTQEDCRHFGREATLCGLLRDVAGSYAAIIEQANFAMTQVSVTLMKDEYVSDYARFLGTQLKMIQNAALAGSETFLSEMPKHFLGALHEVFGDLVSKEIHPQAQRIYDNEMRIGKEIIEKVLADAEGMAAVEGAN
jgi:hypothetical protein